MAGNLDWKISVIEIFCDHIFAILNICKNNRKNISSQINSSLQYYCSCYCYFYQKSKIAAFNILHAVFPLRYLSLFASVPGFESINITPRMYFEMISYHQRLVMSRYNRGSRCFRPLYNTRYTKLVYRVSQYILKLSLMYENSHRIVKLFVNTPN